MSGHHIIRHHDASLYPHQYKYKYVLPSRITSCNGKRREEKDPSYPYQAPPRGTDRLLLSILLVPLLAHEASPAGRDSMQMDCDVSQVPRVEGRIPLQRVPYQVQEPRLAWHGMAGRVMSCRGTCSHEQQASQVVSSHHITS